ncbi:MAG: BREX system P-loop protein BrxC [Coriobacteriia bacterium]|nr:BREX system P-loop protein BrxC [Coriobacteriia bacterium]
MTDHRIRGLFANDIDRQIEEVIKVDQTDEKLVHDELSEYVVTDSIRDSLVEILERYEETPRKSHEGVGVWVSGFFGSGKSSFAKYLGMALADRQVLGVGAASLLSARAADSKVQVLLTNIVERIPTEAVIFDVSTERGIRSGNQSITEIMYRLLLRSLGYAGDLDLSELEITLEEAGDLEKFKAKYAELFQKSWDDEKGKIAVAVVRASRVMHELEPDTYATTDSWWDAARDRADINPGLLAERAIELLDRREPGKSLVFVVDEVGQFVARDVQKMLDLQAVVQNFGRIGRGRLWLVVTSQEKLSELVGGLDDKKVELARLMDRFPLPLQVHLEPSDISEVTGKRVLSKNAEAQATLRDLFQRHRGRLTDNTRMTADIRLPELETDAFIDLYPLLPYQIDLIIQVVSGLRTQGGASKHVGGANRTIIKLAQQLLIHPDVRLADADVGALARLDQVYDLVSGNIGSEIREKIDGIPAKVPHDLAQSVAKVICLLQFVKSVHRTPDNIAAALHQAVDADSRLSEVKDALAALEAAHMVKLGDGGYRIPTPAEDDWEKIRAGLAPRPSDVARLHQEILSASWQPQPQHSLADVKLFKAGLNVNGHQVTDGDIPVNITLAEAGEEFTTAVEDSRKRSQTEDKTIFWVGEIDEKVGRETAELFRSGEVLSRKERASQTKDEMALVAEEKQRQKRHQDELRRLLKQSLLTGTAFFRGNDRSPEQGGQDVGRAAAKMLSKALPEVFNRFNDAAARVTQRDLDALTKGDNLKALTPVFVGLGLVGQQNGQTVINTETGVLAEVLQFIENKTAYGEAPTGKAITEEFAKEPFGWDFDVVRLLVVALVRAGKLSVTSKGQTIESVSSPEAQATFSNNNTFKSAAFRVKVGIDFAQVADAGTHFKEVFGREVPELAQEVVASTIVSELRKQEVCIQDAHTVLVSNALPGAGVLAEALSSARAITSGTSSVAIQTFNGSYREIKDAIKRANELKAALNEDSLDTLRDAKAALTQLWPVLEHEDISAEITEKAATLEDLLSGELFFREIPAIGECAVALSAEHARLHDVAAETRVELYQTAHERLKATPGWEQLEPEQQSKIAGPLSVRATTDDVAGLSIDMLREQAEACPAMLQRAIQQMFGFIDGNRVVCVSASDYFSGGVETEEQLEQAVEGLREKCIEYIAAGKRVLIQ